MAGEPKAEREKGAKPEGEKAPEKSPEKATKRKLSREEKQAQHMDRLKRTSVACGMGIIVGVLSFYLDPAPAGAAVAGTVFGILLLLAGIVFQKYVFLALRMDYLGITTKDWFYQGFMTFSLWFITWTILLSSQIPTLTTP
ncbi:MAG TPA: hypothetical protein VMB35_01925 [Methanomicrobiales archaeon]|nr:hypothetical protein [Methanomicrobiales archaeon]